MGKYVLGVTPPEATTPAATGRIDAALLDAALAITGQADAPGLTEAQAANATLMHTDILIANTEDGALHFVDVTVGHPVYTDPATGEEPLRHAYALLAGNVNKYSVFGAGGNGPPMEGHLGVVHLPFESYGGTLKSVFAW